jgi:hypothetical protein
VQQHRAATLDFKNANPTLFKSIKQRDLLNIWLRLYARDRKTPRIDALTTPTLRVVIDRDLFHRAHGRIPARRRDRIQVTEIAQAQALPALDRPDVATSFAISLA